MIEDLIRHIRSDETGYQVASATAAIYGLTAIACPVVRNLPDLLDVRFKLKDEDNENWSKATC